MPGIVASWYRLPKWLSCPTAFRTVSVAWAASAMIRTSSGSSGPQVVEHNALEEDWVKRVCHTNGRFVRSLSTESARIHDAPTPTACVEPATLRISLPALVQPLSSIRPSCISQPLAWGNREAVLPARKLLC